MDQDNDALVTGKLGRAVVVAARMMSRAPALPDFVSAMNERALDTVLQDDDVASGSFP